MIIPVYRATVTLHHVSSPAAKSRGWVAFSPAETEAIPDAVEPRIRDWGDWYSFEPLGSFSVWRETGSMVEVVSNAEPIGYVKTPSLYTLEEFFFENGWTPWGGRLEPITKLLLVSSCRELHFDAQSAWHDSTHNRLRFHPSTRPVDKPLDSSAITTIPVYESTEQSVRAGELVRCRQRVEFAPIEETLDELSPENSWDLTLSCKRPTYWVLPPEGATVEGEWLSVDGRRATASLVRDWAARGERGFSLTADSDQPAAVDRRRRAEPMRYPAGREPVGTPKLQAMLF